MRRGAKPGKAKVKARPPVVRKSLKNESSRVRDLEERLAEALEQQTATSEILRVISSSPTDVQPVFEAIIANAVRLCDAEFGGVFRFHDGQLHVAALTHVSTEEGDAFHTMYPRPPDRNFIMGRAFLDGRAVHVEDILADPDYDQGMQVGLQRVARFRTLVAVPILRGGVPIGVVGCARREVKPFTATQIELVKTFAEQAMIAIENVRLFKELEAKNSALAESHAQVTEALEQQTATSEILRVISQSPTDVQPVFDIIGERAEKLCAADVSVVSRFDGELIRVVALHGLAQEGVEAVRGAFPMRPSDETVTARAFRNRSVVHIPDVLADPTYETKGAARIGGYHGCLGVPMVREGQVIGVIFVARTTSGYFTDAQVELLKTFADQAVIAVENVRLFTELEARNGELRVALEQQTATSDLLKVIGRSTFDLQPVFDTLAESGVRLCQAQRAFIFRFDGQLLRAVASYNATPELIAFVEQNPIALGRHTGTARAALERRTIHIHDVLTDPEYTYAATQVADFRTVLGIPILRAGELLGVFMLFRDEVRPFADNQIALMETFADQAAIAVENARLLTELQAKNADLTEALEQQTATAEILRVISQSPTDVQPVFDAIAERALQLCGANSSGVLKFDGELVHIVALGNVSADGAAALRSAFPMAPSSRSASARAILTCSIVHIPDIMDEPEYGIATQAEAGGFRSVLSVPMLREGVAIGGVTVGRPSPGRFSDSQITLLKTFADQAVIAVENVRLFKELQARTGELTQSVEKLTALGEVSRAVSSTLDVEMVLDTVVTRATQLAGADGCAISEYDDASELFHVRAAHGIDAALIETLRAMPLRKGEGTMGRAAETREPTQIADIAVPGVYQSHVRDTLIGAGYRALLSVPLLREEQIIGSLSLVRKAPGEYPPEVLDVLKTFATQSALAIQNARLFREIADKSAQLETASRHKSEFLANMSHELRTPLNAIIGFSEVLVDRMFGELNEKQDEYLKDIYASGQHLLSLINDILDLSKIEAGRMELEATDFDLPSAIDNALTLVRERATRRGITLGRTIDEHLGMLRGDERKVKQVLLNLLSNALKFTSEGGRIDVAARVQDGAAEIAVTDTGVGIAPEDQEAVFEEFRQVGTADKKVEGTGLGLALSRKFIELHGGRIWVKSQVGQGATFTFTLPVRRED